MRLFHIGKDGGPESTVTGYWLIEAKNLFSIALLKFSNGSRASYHSHAFNSISWVLSGALLEQHLDGPTTLYRAHPRIVITKRSTFHRVESVGTTWVLTFRGPWSKRWREYNPITKKFITLENGRLVVTTEQTSY